MNGWHVAGIILVIWAVTYLFRAAPFIFYRWMRDNELVAELGLVLPVGVMATLTVAMFHDSLADGAPLLATIAATVATIGIHLWRKSALLSIVVGVAVYGVLGALFP